jgi:ribosomal protein S27AE
MERTTLPRAADEKQDRTRLICPRCGHEVRE